MKKVLFVNQTGRFGGAERVLLDLLAHMDRSRFEPVLVSPAGAMQQEAVRLNVKWIDAPEFEAMDTTRGRLSGGDAGRSIRLVRKLNAIVKRERPDLIYTNSVKAHLLMNLVRRKTPTFVRLHDFPSTFSGAAKHVFRYALRNAWHISCVSQSVETDVKRIVNNRLISYAHNGYQPKPKLMAKTSESEPQHHHANRIIIAGWLVAWKGFDVFVEAMERIADRLPGWAFVIAGAAAEEAKGSAEYAEQLKARVAKSPAADRFVLHGGYKSLQELACCSAHSIFVHASIRPDPLPTVLLEASGAKLPIVCSKLGGSGEIIEHGRSGFIVPPTAEAIAESVLKLAADATLRAAMAEQAYASCRERFGMQAYVDRIARQMSDAMEAVR